MASDDEVFDSMEQSERARKWFQDNGGSLLIAVLSAMAIIWGYKGYQANVQRTAEQAGLNYQAIANAIEAKRDADVAQLSTEMRKNYGSTSFAALAGLSEAKYLVDAGKLDPAITTLKQSAQAGNIPQLKVIADLRLARVMLAQDKSAEALAVLDKITDDGFKAATQELRGDALMRMGKGQDAKAAYASALTATDLAAPGRSTLQLKLDNLSG